MKYRPIPEERRRELAAFIPDLAEARRRWDYGLDAPTEPQFWTEHIFGTRRSDAFPTVPSERLWLLRHARLAATGADPINVDGFQWPGFCVRTGRNATAECWPLEPIPAAKAPPKEPPKETPGPKRADECSVMIEGRVVKPGDVLYYKPDPEWPESEGQARTVSHTRGTNEVWFTNGYWASAAGLTFSAPHIRATQLLNLDFSNAERRVAAHQALAAEYGTWAFNSSKGLTKHGVERTSLQVFNDYMNRRMLELVACTAAPPILVDRTAFHQFQMQFQAAPTPSKLENTMNQATPFTAASLAFDASNIVEVKTFVFDRDIATLDDDTLLNYVQSLTGAIEHLEQLNAKTPLAKLVTKIAQLKDAKAKIVELLGGAPVEQASPAIDADETKPKRVRRTKAEIEADNAAQARAELKAAPIPLTPPPASKVDPDPSADIDYNE